MYEFWYDYVEPKYDETAKLCHMVTDSVTVDGKTEHIYKDIARCWTKIWHFKFWLRQVIA